MASEQEIQEGIQASVREIDTYFQRDSVVINDWTILDRPVSEGSFFNIMTASTFRSRKDTAAEQEFWDIPGMLVVPFVDWNETMILFRDVRQAILDKFNEVGTSRSAGGLEGCTITEIRSGGPVTPAYLAYTDPANRADELPQYLTQLMTFAVETF